jgi:hypothetical protein
VTDSASYDTGAAFLARCRDFLRHNYLPKIRAVVGAMSEEDTWWKPTEDANSAGVLLVHMAGNARQYIISGIGGAPMTRDRDAEFVATGRYTRDEALALFTDTIRECDAVLAALDPARLGERRTIQGNEFTFLEAAFQVSEHVALHTGQIIQLGKLRAPGTIRFYEATSHGVRRLWSRDDA